MEYLESLRGKGYAWKRGSRRARGRSQLLFQYAGTEIVLILAGNSLAVDGLAVNDALPSLQYVRIVKKVSCTSYIVSKSVCLIHYIQSKVYYTIYIVSTSVIYTI